MNIPEAGPGVAIEIGGTWYRFGKLNDEGAVVKQEIIETPTDPDVFFRNTVHQISDSAEQGARWVAIGIPGPVKYSKGEDGQLRYNLRLTNVEGLKRKEGFDPVEEMIKAEPSEAYLFEPGGVTLLVENDGTFAAYAAALTFGKEKGRQLYDAFGNVIVGTGIGAGMVRRHENEKLADQNIFVPDRGKWEAGHMLDQQDGDPARTNEAIFSPPNLAIKYRVDSLRDLPDDHPAFREIARGVGGIIFNSMANIGGANLVAISGGVGTDRQDALRRPLMERLDEISNSDNPMADLIPEVVFAPRGSADVYAMRGAPYLVRSQMAKAAVGDLIAKSTFPHKFDKFYDKGTGSHGN